MSHPTMPLIELAVDHDHKTNSDEPHYHEHAPYNPYINNI